jgi:hypothetical protein
VLGVTRRIEKLRAAVGDVSRHPIRSALSGDLDRLKAQIGGLECRHVATLEPNEIARSEFQVFSQFGEDGIIQFLIQRVAIDNSVFVELGVADYSESNTRFLLVHDNWRGLVVDSGQAVHRFLRSSDLSWRHDLQAVSAFIDRDNVNELIRTAGIEGDIGLLSIDLDGNDYWILETIDAVSPRILVTEYNSTFGAGVAVTVPYDAGFVREQKHWSALYWGASLAAITKLAGEKGYALVGGNRAGNNAFYVRRDVLGSIPEVSVRGAYALSRFRESRSQDGELSYVADHDERLRLIASLPLVDVDRGNESTVAELFDLD